MATFNIRYSANVVYNVTIVADSEEEAKEIVVCGDCDPGEEYDIEITDFHFVNKIGE